MTSLVMSGTVTSPSSFEGACKVDVEAEDVPFDTNSTSFEGACKVDVEAEDVPFDTCLTSFEGACKVDVEETASSAFERASGGAFREAARRAN